MQIRCANCTAFISLNQSICPYCGITVKNADEELVRALMDVKRRYELATARGNKLEVSELLAAEFQYKLTDAGSESTADKPSLLETLAPDENFVSYAFGNEELLDRTATAATLSGVETISRRVPEGFDPNYYFRTVVKFVLRDGRWLMRSQESVTIDEHGAEIE
jgi:hypothetical protein